MKTLSEPGVDALFPIEWFFRVKADWRAVLELDALVLQRDLPPDEHNARITQFIQRTYDSVTGATKP